MRTLVSVLGLLVGVAAAQDTSASSTETAASCAEAAAEATTAEGPAMNDQLAAANVATAEKSGTIALPATDGQAAGEAFEFTLEPVIVNPDETYLVQVQIAAPCGSEGAGAEPQDIGTVSFFPPPREGEARTFVLPAPERGDASDWSRNAEFVVKLVPANPQLKLQDSAVEVLDAKLR